MRPLAAIDGDPGGTRSDGYWWKYLRERIAAGESPIRIHSDEIRNRKAFQCAVVNLRANVVIEQNQETNR